MQLVIPNLRHLRVFLEVADCRSISQAAPRVFLSQPAITQAIAKVEKMLGTELFERHTDGMYPTAAGKVWYNRIQRCIDYIEQGARDALRNSPARTQSAQTNILPMLTTTQLRALIAVTEAENFSIASRNLGISQSSLHRAARELEQLLEVRLFEKTSTGISTTKAAKALARAAKLGFSEIHQGYFEISALQFREVGKIVVGSMPLARTSILPNVINRFAKEHPDVGINIVDAPYNDLLHHLRHGDIDFLIGALRFPTPVDDIVQEQLLAPPLAIVARRGHPLEYEQNLDLKTLAQYPWVVPRSGAPTRTYFDTLFSENGIPIPTGLVETSSQILIRELLLGSDRLTLISSHQIEHERALGLLRVIPFALSHTRRPIGITMRRNWQATPTQKAFLDMLREAAQNYADL
ncbi:transcriptional regulator [Marinobacterium zhoushanense]|uniref:Transcriptional regulator n=1 Tax=Marinobacterium zhoushanense TaxID=1679163 RepID=A0ABQ1KGF3_9GAMM|nr:LysR family transcriptional regulator [Marinobacterium zhoushanense]GGB94794.1 transcriptional regulator [Marinobacterium zhoushanense]